MNSLDRHFCVTIYIYDKENNSFLMIKHKKLKKWLPPGGHVEHSETPDEAAIREAKEETGLDIELIGTVEPFEGCLTKPLGIQLNVIEKDQHEHIDIIYLAYKKNHQQELVKNARETNGLAWIKNEKIQSNEFNTFDSIKHWCNKISET